MMKSTLTRQITIQVALVIFAAMLVYAIFQYLAGEVHPVTLLLRHLWHTIVLGIMIYAFLLWRLRTLVFRPLQAIFFHGYEMSKGEFRSREYPKTHNEMDQVSGMMNLIAEHLAVIRQTSWKGHADSIERHLESLRARQGLPMDVHDDLAAIRDSLRKMEAAVMRFVEIPAWPSDE